MTEKISFRRAAQQGSCKIEGSPVYHWNGHSDRVGLAKGKWHLYNGDAKSVLRSIASAQFDCVVTSPPYFWQRDYAENGQLGFERSISGYVNDVANVMDEVFRVLKPGGVLFLNLGDTYYSGKGRPQGVDRKHKGRRMNALRAVDASGLGVPQKSAIGIPWRVALEMINRGWVLRSPIIWRREKPLPEANVKDRPWRTYEHIYLFAKSRHYNFSRRPLQVAGVEDVWTIESQGRPDNQHPAPFPSELVERCLDLANLKRGWVLDPFVGSGTVMRVAIERGLNAVGVDLNKKFCQRLNLDLTRPSL